MVVGEKGLELLRPEGHKILSLVNGSVVGFFGGLLVKFY